MGNRSKPELHSRVADWGESFRADNRALDCQPTTSALKQEFDFELKEYFRLCCLARSKTADHTLAERAHATLFRVRVVLERSILNAIRNSQCSSEDRLDALFKNSFYGCSKKQGTSLRMPLATCTPTKLCAGGCYAHDVLDAAPNAMIRGAINGCIAETYEQGNGAVRDDILNRLLPHTRRGVSHAMNELKRLPDGFKRRAFIRFSHVGEIVYFADFANALANQVNSVSKGKVDCVVYTRHKNVTKLDRKNWIINFTLDPSSLERRAWAPSYSRIVFSAFGGQVSPLAEVNFLEHHRHSHLPKTSGVGRICPATLPETRERSCDSCQCNRCFTQPKAQASKILGQFFIL